MLNYFFLSWSVGFTDHGYAFCNCTLCDEVMITADSKCSIIFYSVPFSYIQYFMIFYSNVHPLHYYLLNSLIQNCDSTFMQLTIYKFPFLVYKYIYYFVYLLLIRPMTLLACFLLCP